MRKLRFFAIVVFVLSTVFCAWANFKYYSSTNADKPVLTSETQLLQLSVEADPQALLQGLSAWDETDGDLTDQILVASVSHFIEPGTVKVKYVVFDDHNNSASLTRMVHYTDYQSPVFSLSQPPVYVKGDRFDLLDHIRVTDDLDGDISDRVRVISNTVSNFMPGTYPVVLEVSNSCGDTAKLELMVTYLDKAGTVSIKLHDHIVYLQQGQSFEPYRWISSVTDADNMPLDAQKVSIQGNLDVHTPGYYSLVYSYSDGGLTGQTGLTVVVTQKEP